MSSTVTGNIGTWRMPIVPESYDRSPLTEEEKHSLSLIVQYPGLTRSDVQQAKRDLLRLETPIFDVLALRVKPEGSSQYRKFRRLLYGEMHLRGMSFWEWSQETWKDIICLTNLEYFEKHVSFSCRPSLMDMAYLLYNGTKKVDRLMR